MNDELNGNNNDLRKALDISAAGTELIPEVVSAGIRRFVETASPIYSSVPKKDWPTNSYIFRSVTDLPTATFGTDGGNLPVASTGTYDKAPVAMKYIYTRGEVTGPMQRAAGSLVDAYQLEIELHSLALVRKLEQTIITGSVSSNDEFDGLLAQISTNTLDKTVSAAPSLLTLSAIDEALDLPTEYPSAAIMTRAMGRRVWSLLQSQQRFVDRTEVAGGFRVPTYNDLPILRVDSEITGLTNTIVFPDWRWVVMPINQQATFEPLAKTKDSDDFMIKMYCTLAVEGEARYHAKLIGVKPS